MQTADIDKELQHVMDEEDTNDDQVTAAESG